MENIWSGEICRETRGTRRACGSQVGDIVERQGSPSPNWM